ncbi:ATP synthase delta chain [uncultured Candidatus Thioglobus sp.]|nr:ATP synthase delta chain [uncultured Candidatus Thioglobus sp.]
MELTTIAKPYANAIFQIAEQSQFHQNWKTVLEVGAFIANDTLMREFIASPSVTKTHKSEVIIVIFQAALGREFSQKEVAFVNLLLKNGRIDALPSISTLFNALISRGSDAKAFQVTSAYKLSEAEEKQIVKDLSEKYNTAVSIDAEIDENLVGGVVIKEGDKVIDLSIQARVSALGSHLSVA